MRSFEGLHGRDGDGLRVQQGLCVPSPHPTHPSPPALTAVGAVLADTTDSDDDEAGSEKED